MCSAVCAVAETSVPAKRPRSGSATASVILPLMGVIAPVVLPLLGLVFSIVGLIQTRGGRKRGRGLAVAGLFLSLVMVPASVCISPMGGVFLPGIRNARDMAKRGLCEAHLRDIGKGIAMYYGCYGDQFPASLEGVLKDSSSPNIFQCPSDNNDRRIGFFYLQPIAPDGNADFSALLACDYAGNHYGHRNVLFVDFHVMQPPKSQNVWSFKTHVAQLNGSQFQQALSEPRNARFAAALKKAEDDMGIGGK